MADPTEAFPMIVDPATNIGEYLGRRQEGQAAAAINGTIGFAFKTLAGNVVLPVLTAEGKVPVDFQGAGTAKKARGELAAGSASLVLVTGASIPLTVDLVYRALTGTFSCRRDALFQVIWDDDGSESILVEAVVGPGQYSFHFDHPNHEFTAGSTGTQALKVVAQNLGSGSGALSSLRATITTVEQVAGA